MQMRIPIAKALALSGQIVKIAGFIETIRDQKRMLFFVLRDRSGSLQCVVEKTGGLAISLKGLTIGSAVSVEGRIVENSIVTLGGVEMQAHSATVESLAASPIPVSNDSNVDVRMDWRYLDLRLRKNIATFEVSTLFLDSIRRYWIERSFIELISPKLMSAASESGAELFAVDYFEGKAYLAQSPQFYKQMAIASGFESVFEIGPVFRAEPSYTARHATEFTSVDAEVAWITSHSDIMDHEEAIIKFAIDRIRTLMGPRIFSIFGLDLPTTDIPFARITYSDVIKRLREAGWSGDSLDTAGERLIGTLVEKEVGILFIFVTDYPTNERPFYHMRSEDGTTTRSFDLLYRGIEITTGAQREHRHEVLERQALEKGLTKANIGYYLDFFKYGCPPHGGFGFGLARFLMVLLGLESIRESTFLFRSPKRLTP